MTEIKLYVFKVRYLGTLLFFMLHSIIILKSGAYLAFYLFRGREVEDKHTHTHTHTFLRLPSFN